MKKALLICLTISHLSFCSTEFTSQSFMFTRPVGQNSVAQDALWHNIVHNKHGKSLSSFHITGIYKRSIEQNKTKKYFLFDGKTVLKIRGDSIASELNTRDIRAEWLNLPANFSSEITIDPEQKQSGLILEYNFDFKKKFKNSLLEQYSLTISAPLVLVENNINFKEFNIQNPGTTANSPANATESFSQQQFHYGKIINKQRSTIDIAHIAVKLGTTYMSKNNFQVAYFSQLLFPTAQKDEAHYMFESIAGNNGHIGIGAGAHFQFPINRNNEKCDICFFLNLENIFFIRRKHTRVLDLNNKPWSRYLLLNKQNEGDNQNIPAINILSQQVIVRPYNMIDATFGWRFKTDRVELELGYNIWGHGAEKLEFENDHTFDEVYGIAAPAGGILSASASSIKTQSAADAAFTPIKKSNLDLKSGASKSTLTHKIQLAGGIIKEGNFIDGTLGLGIFYEVPQKNSALKLWGIWTKIAASF